jgi:hypothetical protein
MLHDTLYNFIFKGDVNDATFRIKRFHDDVTQARKYATDFCSPWSQPNGQNEGTIYGPT